MTNNKSETKKILAADFWLVFNFDDPNRRYQKFLQRGRKPFKRLIENVLLYDNITIPTQDYLTLTALIGVLGEKEVTQLIEQKQLSFIRVNGSLAYVGNGGGVQSYQIGGKDTPLMPFCAPIEEAVDWAINGLETKTKNKNLSNLVLKSTKEIAVKDVLQQVKNETYQDILTSPNLQGRFNIKSKDLDNLEGINPNQVRIYGGMDANWKGDSIDTLMALTNINLEMKIFEESKSDDAISEGPLKPLIESKAKRTFEKPADIAFTEFRSISGIPDLGESVLQKQTSIEKILKLKHSKKGENFKKWFHENCREDTITTAKEYANLLREIPQIQSSSSRIIRFLITNVAGLVHPAAGLGLGATDSFLIDSLFKGNSPKFFIEDLEKLAPHNNEISPN